MPASPQTDDGAPSLLARCRADPTYFGRVILDRRRWSKQEEMRRAIDVHRRTHVRSANGVGKTFELASIVCEWLPSNPQGRVLCTGPTFETVHRGLWQEVRRCFAAARVPLGGRMGEHEWTLGAGWDAVVASVDNPSAIQGGRGRKLLIVVDEAQGVDNVDLWDALESLMSARDSRMISSGNPLVTSGRYYQQSLDPTWHHIHIDGLDHPNVVSGEEIFLGSITRHWVEEKRQAWGENDPRWWARVRGQFPPVGMNQLIPIVWMDEGERNPEPIPALKGRRIGLDVARFGDDWTVLAKIEDGKLVDVIRWRDERTTATAGRVIAEAKAWNVEPHNVKIDVCGVGAGVVDECFACGMVVDAVDFGAGVEEDWADVCSGSDFMNRRGELYWAARELIRLRHLQIPASFDGVRTDLAAPKYDYPKGTLRVEEKDSIKKRLGRSPDEGDAVVVALSNASRTGLGITWF